MDPFLASIWFFGGNFNPIGFALCAGQILPISQNAALFSLLGTNFGGNGTSNFSLPDLRGRTPIGQGQGPGLSQYYLGEMTGTENTTLLSNNIPPHTHLVNALNAFNATGAASSPQNAIFSEGKKGTGIAGKAPNLYTPTAANTTLNPLSVGVNVGGGSIPVNILQPFLAVTAIICTSGVFPARN